MIRLKDELLKGQFLELLKSRIEECLYLAIDLEMYGLDNPNVSFYYDMIDGKLNTLLMKYYDSVQMFSPSREWKAEAYVDFIKELAPIAISARKDIIEKLTAYLPEYFVEYGIVIADNTYMSFKQYDLIRKAEVDDALSIAKLMMSSEEFSQNNTLETLEIQLRDRMESGYGRSYIIEENGVIAAHTAIYAECGTVAVESGLVVHEDYKRKFYGMIIHEYIKKVLTEEGKTLFGLRYNDSMRNNAKNEKLKIAAECGRLIIKRGE